MQVKGDSFGPHYRRLGKGLGETLALLLLP